MIYYCYIRGGSNMNVMKLDYDMEIFNEQNVELMISTLGLNTNNYLITMTKPSLLSVSAIGSIAEFANRYCIICFSDTELNLIMLSRINSKKVTELIKIQRNEISNIKLSNILVSYMLNIKASESTFKFQVFKKVARFTKIKNSIETFKKMYNL